MTEITQEWKLLYHLLNSSSPSYKYETDKYYVIFSPNTFSIAWISRSKPYRHWQDRKRMCRRGCYRKKNTLMQENQGIFYTSSRPWLLLLFMMLYLQSGQVALMYSHLSIQPQWKWWPQGSSRSSTPSSYEERQMQHSCIQEDEDVK